MIGSAASSVLKRDEMGVVPTLCEQLLMPAALYDAAMVHCNDMMGMPD
jgi:hypothetical protein